MLANVPLFIRIITKLSAALNVDDEQFLSASLSLYPFLPTHSLSHLNFLFSNSFVSIFTEFWKVSIHELLRTGKSSIVGE